MIIYAIKHMGSENMYVGQTISPLNQRWSQHRNSLRNNCHFNPHLQNAWNKYGENAFEFEVVDDTAKNLDELNALEISYVAIVGYYNVKTGGINGIHSEETKRKIGDANKGKIRSKETKRKMSEAKKGKYAGENHPRYGKTHTNKSKQKMSEAHKNKPLSEEHKRKMKGKIRSIEHCKALSESLKGKPWSSARRAAHEMKI